MAQVLIDVEPLLRIVADEKYTSLTRYVAKQVWSSRDRDNLLNSVCELMLTSDGAIIKDIASCLGPAISDVLFRLRAKLSSEKTKTGGATSHDIHILELQITIVLGVLCELEIPAVTRIILDHFQEVGHPFGYLTSATKSEGKTGVVRAKRKKMPSIPLNELILSLRQMLELIRFGPRYLIQFQNHQFCPAISTFDWPWHKFVTAALGSDELTTPGHWALLNIIARLLNFKSDNVKWISGKTVDELWRLHYSRCKSLAITWRGGKEHQHGVCSMSDEKTTPPSRAISSGDLTSNLVPVCGVLLLRAKLEGSRTDTTQETLTLTSPMQSCLHDVSLGLTSGCSILLEGSPGCGKSALIDYLAAGTGRDSGNYIKIRAGETMDSKVLTGTYKCTPVPGEFVWQPGVLAQAVQNGHWVLMEDIDKAPMDVVSLLMPLLENGYLNVHGHSYGTAKNAFCSGFRLFMTHTTAGSEIYKSRGVAMLSKHARVVHLPEISPDDLQKIVVDKFPNLESIVGKLLRIFDDLTNSAGRNAFSSLSSRKLSVRDLFRLCKRLSERMVGSGEGLSVTVAREAIDCLVASCMDEGERESKLHVICSSLNLSAGMGEYYLQEYCPDVMIKPVSVMVGRVTITKTKSSDPVVIKQPFAITRSSSVILERIACAVSSFEPILLVGETGVGKTSVVQFLAELSGRKLHTLNMSQQSSASDLLGSFKPSQTRHMVAPVREEFERLFRKTFSQSQNLKFLQHAQTCFVEKRYKDLLSLMSHCLQPALKKLDTLELYDEAVKMELQKSWQDLSHRIIQLRSQLAKQSPLAFSFVEGILSQALKSGDWLLLDEVNLALPETLDCLAGVLESQTGSVTLLENGESVPLKRHSEFRLFATMNPATDVGKKNLPPDIRNRFVEFYVPEPKDECDLRALISYYLDKRRDGANVAAVNGILSFYKQVRKLSTTKLGGSVGTRPHFTLRTLCRALRFVAAHPGMSLSKALYEGLCLSFLTELDHCEHEAVENLIISNVVGKSKSRSVMKMSMPPPSYPYVTVEGFHIRQGDHEPVNDTGYIMTASVKRNLKILSRAVAYGRYPILIQGDTSTGKTSIIKYLAALTGNTVTRINNHEHTDLDELIGSYTSCGDGRLVFQEGPLVTALRKGYWIILDELNLAPTDILESLNRVLDDNRELFIPETQEKIAAHPRFTLFATQNPPGVYGGRKVLSRAFKNRFIELHFGELPSDEIQNILHHRCHLPLSRCKKLIVVMKDLQAYRRTTGIFAGKHGFITLRDLFKWAERSRTVTDEEDTGKSFDLDGYLAENGYLLLAGRVRNTEEEQLIIEVLTKHFRRNISLDDIFSEKAALRLLNGSFPEGFKHIVLTKSFRRMLVMLQRALRFDEPVLLVGETGCGKTAVCQMVSAADSRNLLIVNCHSHTDASDFLGGLRPVRDHSAAEENEKRSLFEWVNGPLVNAMEAGSNFLVDEISLAADSVLERLNSVLEVERTLLLLDNMDSDKGMTPFSISAKHGFHFMATMNPGGDFGKKELSPAIRNRFTEVWCRPVGENAEDAVAVILHNMKLPKEVSEIYASMIVEFIRWFTSVIGSRYSQSIRDVIKWVDFMNATAHTHCILTPAEAYTHAALLIFVDGIGSGLSHTVQTKFEDARAASVEFILRQLTSAEQVAQLTAPCKSHLRSLIDSKANAPSDITYKEKAIGMEPFFIPTGPKLESDATHYTFRAPTTSVNCFRLLRALQLPQPILLEGSPGIGKTSLVKALAMAAGHELVRINLSEQTDVSDLFGADLPVEGGVGGHFEWVDGPLLSALKNGSWIVFDELNLASQPVLEGLNSVLDHRAEIFIPDLGRTFHVRSDETRIFACQNPSMLGDGRKGLPKSFLNRFNQVFMDVLCLTDMLVILSTQFPSIPSEVLNEMILFNEKVNDEIVDNHSWAQHGSPWEFNLRDLTRWCELMICGGGRPEEHMYLVYCERLQTLDDRKKMCNLFTEIFDGCVAYQPSCHFSISPELLQVGNVTIKRKGHPDTGFGHSLQILPSMLHSMESLMNTLKQGWMCILTGQSGCGKSSLVSALAALTGNTLKIFSVNSSMDATDLLGRFEQSDFVRSMDEIFQGLTEAIVEEGKTTFESDMKNDVQLNSTKVILEMISTINKYKSKVNDARTVEEATVHAGEFCRVFEPIAARYKDQDNGEEKLATAGFIATAKKLVAKFQANWKGTYEWVDSVLVESLKNGHWLLIDGANRCSPSVLDRLNALLEPSGVLTITERGIVNDSLVEIRPHPEFRLILCMDTSQGNISRAMRNRGVEIYMMSPDCGTLDEITGDKCTGVFSQGLTWQEVEQIATYKFSKLLCVHPDLRQNLVRFVVDLFENGYTYGPRIDWMIRCVKSIEEIAGRIVSGYDAIESAVLICSRVLDDDAQSEELITNLRKSCEADTVNILLPVISVGKMLQHSTAAHVFWQAAFFGRLREHTLTSGLEWTDLAKAGCKLFVTLSSVGDYQMRLQLLTDFLEPHVGKQCLESSERIVKESVFENKAFSILQDELKKECKEEYRKQVEHLPWDPRWSRQLMHNTGITINCLNASILNRMSLLLTLTWNREELEYHLKNAGSSSAERKEHHQPGKSVARIAEEGILVLSVKYHNSLVTLQDLPHPAVAYIFPLYRRMSHFLLSAVQSADVKISFEEELDKALGVLSIIHCIWRHFLSWSDFDVPVFLLYCKKLRSSALSLMDHIVSEGSRNCVPFFEVEESFKSINKLLGCDKAAFVDIQLQGRLHATLASSVIGAVPYRDVREVELDSFAKNTLLTLTKLLSKIGDSNDENSICDSSRRSCLYGFMVRVCRVLSNLQLERSSRNFRPETSETVDEGLEATGAGGAEEFACELQNIQLELDSLIHSADLQLSDEVRQSTQPSMELYPISLNVSLKAMKDIVFRLKCSIEEDSEVPVISKDFLEKFICFTTVHGVASPDLLTACLVLQGSLEQPSRDLGVCVSNQASKTFLTFANALLNNQNARLFLFSSSNVLTSVGQTMHGHSINSVDAVSSIDKQPTVSDVSSDNVWCGHQVSLLKYKESCERVDMVRQMLWINSGFGSVSVSDMATHFLHHFVPILNMILEAKCSVFLFAQPETISLMKEIGFLTDNIISTATEVPEMSPVLGVLSDLKGVVTRILKEHCPPPKMEHSSQWVTLCQRQFSAILDPLLKMLTRLGGWHGKQQSAEETTLRVSLYLMQCWIWTGSFLLNLISPQQELDPLEKHRGKSVIVQKQVSSLKNETTAVAAYYESTTGKSISNRIVRHAFADCIHPMIPIRFKRLEYLQEKLQKVISKCGYRGSPEQFKTLVRSCKQLNTAMTPDHLRTMMEPFAKAAEGLSKGDNLCEHVPKMLDSLPVLEQMLQTVNSFSSRLHDYVALPDFTIPLQDSLDSVQHALNMAKDLIGVVKFYGTHADMSLEQFFTNLLGFDTNLSASAFTSFAEKLVGDLRKWISEEDLAGLTDGLVERVIMVLMTKYKKSILFRGASCKDFDQVLGLLNHVLNLKKAQEGIEKDDTKAKPYHATSHLEDTGEEVEEKEFQEMFEDFSMDVDEEAEPSSTAVDQHDKQRPLLGDHVMKMVMQVHKDIVDLTGPETCVLSAENRISLNPGIKSASESTDANMLEPIYYGYHQFHNLFEYMSNNMLHATVDELSDVSCLVVKKMAESLDNSQVDLCNIRKEANPALASRCLPVLQGLKSYIKDSLLKEWPEHPTLLKIIQIIDRIVGFSIHSPLMKFLVGLELVLSQSQEWEQNAHIGVSLQIHLEKITDLVLEWRKMEIKCWGMLLDETIQKQSSISPSLYFSTYELLLSDVEALKLVESLQQFMEVSTLAEYPARLGILNTFLKHLCMVRDSRTDVKTVLWNTILYYSQFDTSVSQRVQAIQKPIAKDLKDFLEIAKWNDKNFYSIKASVEKLHRHLFKLVKKFSSGLTECVRTNILTVVADDLVNTLDSKCSSEVTSETDRHIEFEGCSVAVVTAAEKTAAEAGLEAGQLIRRVPKLIPKMKSIHSDWGDSMSGLFSKLDALEHFIGDIISSSQHLKALEPATPYNKSNEEIQKKRLSEAKNIQSRKRKALNDLFKELADMGLSYKKGIIYSRHHASDKLLCAPIIEPTISGTGEQVIETSAVPGVVTFSNSCPLQAAQRDYFYKCISRWASLSLSLDVPHKDMTRNNVERVRGFIGHLMKMSLRQRSWLSQFIGSESRILKVVTALESCSSSASVFPQEQCWEAIKSLKKPLDDWCLSLHHFASWMDCCPSERSDGEADAKEMLTPFPDCDLSAMNKMKHGDSTWTSVMAKVKSCLEISHIIKTTTDRELKKLDSNSCHVMTDLSLSNTCEQLSHAKEAMSGLEEYLTELFRANARMTKLPWMVTQLLKHSSALESHHKTLSTLISHQEDDTQGIVKESKDLFKQTSEVVSAVLLTFQGLNKSTEGHKEDTVGDLDMCDLKDLHAYIRECLTALHLDSVTSKAEKFVSSLMTTKESSLLKMLPDVSQILLPVVKGLLGVVKPLRSLVQSMHRTTCKLCYVLCTIFIELCFKGFCPPSGFEESELEAGSEEFAGIDEGGIGEGEGMKDVSDKIEDRGQIEGGDDQSKSENADVPDPEDDAIEREEDFEAEFGDEKNDPRQVENSDEEEEDDEEAELDKQMGDCSEEASQENLDEKLWGSEDEEEEKASKSEQKGAGDQKSESELAAKDDGLDDVPNEENEKDKSEFNPDEMDDQYGEEEESGKENDLDLQRIDDTTALDDQDMEEQEDVDPSQQENEAQDNPESMEDEQPEEEPEMEESGDLQSGEIAADDDDAEDAPVENDGKPSEMDATPEADDESGDHDDPEISSRPKDSTPSATEEGVSERCLNEESSDATNQERADEEERSRTDMNNQNNGQQEESVDDEGGSHGNAADDKSSRYMNSAIQKPLSTTENNQKTARKPLQNPPKRSSGGETNDTPLKRLKLVSSEQSEDNGEQGEAASDEAMYQHVQDASAPNDRKTLDLATDDDAHNEVDGDIKDENESGTQNENEVCPAMDHDAEPVQPAASDIRSSEKTTSEEVTAVNNEDLVQQNTVIEKPSIQSDVLSLSEIHSNALQTARLNPFAQHSEEEIAATRKALEAQLQSWKQENDSIRIAEAAGAWQKCCMLTQPLAMQLTEQLRLILEPTEAAQFKGDYRTGKRLNMRKVIPYIASNFRNDKIWLRRHKPSKRKYQILLAIDDSSSMADNHSKQITYESVAVVSTALTTLEAGQLGICSFGEKLELVHDFGEPFTVKSGASILSRCTFSQNKTRVAECLDSSTKLLQAAGQQYSSSSSPAIPQLLLIISDGRGLYLEGRDRVVSAVHAAQEAGIFIAFIIVDQPGEKVHSILDIKVPVFGEAGKMPEIKSYLDIFPFPFYLILRDINALPHTLGDALRQWFEIMAELM